MTAVKSCFGASFRGTHVNDVLFRHRHRFFKIREVVYFQFITSLNLHNGVRTIEEPAIVQHVLTLEVTRVVINGTEGRRHRLRNEYLVWHTSKRFFLKLFLFLASVMIFLRSLADISFKFIKCFMIILFLNKLFQ